jgi:hypothetical protein
VERIPLLSGSRVVLVPVDEGDVVVRPPAPPEQVADVAAAVRDALRFPLAGPSLDAVTPRGGRATIVVEPPAHPLPGASPDPRQSALAAAIDELDRRGIPDERQTILVAGGLGRRLGQRELERLLPPPRARAFRGNVVVHDAESPDLVPIAEAARVNGALVDTDLVLVVTAAETIVHGGPGALVSACDAETVRRSAGADSLIEAAGAPEWTGAVRLTHALAQRVPVIGISLVLDLPRLTGTFRGYPDDPAASDQVRSSWLRAGFSGLPAVLRRDILGGLGRRISATAAFAGPPAVAHAEALLRGVALRGTRMAEPAETLVAGTPWIGPHYPREPLNPITTAAIVLGLALRLRRDAFPVAPDGTLILVSSLTRTFAHGTQAPYAAAFNALRAAEDPDALAEAEHTAGADPRAVAAYRAGKACHPLLPYADWAGCAPALARLGRVVVAGSRDAIAARALGFVPSRSLGSALEMAHGVAGRRTRVGVLLAPPYAPLLVG